MALSHAIDISTDDCFVSLQSGSLKDRQTDRRTDRIAIAIPCVEEDEGDNGDNDAFIKQVYTRVQNERKK